MKHPSLLALGPTLLSSCLFDSTDAQGLPCIIEDDCGPKIYCIEGICGGQLDLPTLGGEGDDADTSNPTSPTPTTGDTSDDPMTGDDTTVPPDSDPPSEAVSGTYLFAVSTNLAQHLPLQFFTTVDAADPSWWTITLQPLSLDIDRTSTPQQPFGEPFVFNDVHVVDGHFTLDFGEIFLHGETNPITAEDITATIVMAGRVLEADFFCGDVTGAISSPLGASIDGSTFAAARVSGLNALPDAITIDCAGNTASDQ